MVSATAPRSGFAGHPAGLSTLFFTEMWERFSYYGMRALLILYMTAAVTSGGLGWTTERSGHLYGLYTSSVYLMAIPGGFLADRVLGTRRAVLLGGILIALGHYSLATGLLSFFYAGLVLIVLGTGLLKPNISAMVGQLYTEGDARRDAGFSIYYMGINLGAFVAPLVCGYLGQRIGWHWGFGAAGIGMTLGLIQYVAGRRRLGDAGLRVEARSPKASAGAAARSADEGKRIGVIVILFVFATLFWAGFEQAGSSLNLFARDFTNNAVLGLEFPSSWFQSVNPLLIITLAPVFAWLWVRLGPREPSSPAKFALGLFFLSAGFWLIALAAQVSGGQRVSPMWLLVMYLFHTIGELCLSPVGLSTVTKLAPARLVGLMMGLWFLASSAGNYVSGWAATYFEKLPLPQLFGRMAWVSLAAAVVLAVLVRPIRRLMGDVH